MPLTQQIDIIRKEAIKELGQLRPANTTAASLYSPPSNVIGMIEVIIVTNTTSGAIAARVFIDANGTTYDESTALLFDKSIAANDFLRIEGPFYISNSAGNLAVRTATNSALTFSAYGKELK